MSRISVAEAARIGKALGDPTRLDIYSYIVRQGELYCGEVCKCNRLSMATISHHLAVLSRAGLIVSQRKGQFIFYRAVPEHLVAYRKFLAELSGKTVRRGVRSRQ